MPPRTSFRVQGLGGMGRRSSAAFSLRPGRSSSRRHGRATRTPPSLVPKRTARRFKQPGAAAFSPPSRRRGASRREERHGGDAPPLDVVEDRFPAAGQPSRRSSRGMKTEREGSAGDTGDEKEEEEEEGEEGEDSEEDEVQAKTLGEGFYEVETVKGKRTRKGKLQYLIKWQGWPESANTWEPYDNVKDCDDIIQQFEESHKTKTGRKKRKSGTFPLSQKKTHISGLTADVGPAAKVTEENTEEPVISKTDPNVGIESTDISKKSGANRGTSTVIDNSNPEKLEADYNVNAVRSSGDSNLETQQRNLTSCNESLPKDVIDAAATITTNGNCTLKGETLISDIAEQELLQYATRSTVGPELKTVNKDDFKKRLVKIPIIEDEDPGKLAAKDKQTGAKKRKQGFVRRVRQGLEFQEHDRRPAPTEERMMDIEQINMDSKVVNGGLLETEVKEIQKVEACSQICENLDITEIVKAVSYSSSTENNKQDVSVLFKATRLDGQEVMVDNKFLRNKHPLLLIDFYEQHLRYSTTQ